MKNSFAKLKGVPESTKYMDRRFKFALFKLDLCSGMLPEADGEPISEIVEEFISHLWTFVEGAQQRGHVGVASLLADLDTMVDALVHSLLTDEQQVELNALCGKWQEEN